MAQKSSCKYENNMLNLTIGKRYKFTIFAHNTPIVGTIIIKNVRDATHHSYWVSWWSEERKQNIGHYIFDCGYANMHRTIVYNMHSIRTCIEVSPSSDASKC